MIGALTSIVIFPILIQKKELSKMETNFLSRKIFFYFLLFTLLITSKLEAEDYLRTNIDCSSQNHHTTQETEERCKGKFKPFLERLSAIIQNSYYFYDREGMVDLIKTLPDRSIDLSKIKQLVDELPKIRLDDVLQELDKQNKIIENINAISLAKSVVKDNYKYWIDDKDTKMFIVLFWLKKRGEWETSIQLKKSFDLAHFIAENKFFQSFETLYEVFHLEKAEPRFIVEKLLTFYSFSASLSSKRNLGGFDDGTILKYIQQIYSRAKDPMNINDVLYILHLRIFRVFRYHAIVFTKENINTVVNKEALNLFDWQELIKDVNSVNVEKKKEAITNFLGFFRQAPWALCFYLRVNFQDYDNFYKNYKHEIFDEKTFPEHDKMDFGDLSLDEINKLKEALTNVDSILAAAKLNLSKPDGILPIRGFFPNYSDEAIRSSVSKMLIKLSSIARVGTPSFKRELSDLIASVYFEEPKMVRLTGHFFDSPPLQRAHFLLHEYTHSTISSSDRAEIDSKEIQIYGLDLTMKLSHQTRNSGTPHMKFINSDIMRVADPITYVVFLLAQPLKNKGFVFDLKCDYTSFCLIRNDQEHYLELLVSGKHQNLPFSNLVLPVEFTESERLNNLYTNCSITQLEKLMQAL